MSEFLEHWNVGFSEPLCQTDWSTPSFLVLYRYLLLVENRPVNISPKYFVAHNLVSGKNIILPTAGFFLPSKWICALQICDSRTFIYSQIQKFIIFNTIFDISCFILGTIWWTKFKLKENAILFQSWVLLLFILLQLNNYYHTIVYAHTSSICLKHRT